MPVYVYTCPKGHVTERIAAITTPGEPIAETPCTVKPFRKGRQRGAKECGLAAVLTPALTGKFRLKKGIGGFHAPNA